MVPSLHAHAPDPIRRNLSGEPGERRYGAALTHVERRPPWRRLLVLAPHGRCGDDEGRTTGPARRPRTRWRPRRRRSWTAPPRTGLPGQLTRTGDGVRAVDLTTSDQTIVLHVHESEEDAEAYDGDTLDFEVVGNVVVLGGAISPENRTIIDGCVESS